MTSYLLLRNNKESGPFSFEELVNQGLKAYDLVWIKDKSAAWRYPGEIAELKEYAPPVEEQPFDRFYKKQSDEKKEEVIAVKKEEVRKEEPAPIQKEQPAYTPKKNVFVTLPGQKQQPVRQEPPVSEPSYKKYQPPVGEEIDPVPVAKTITITENPVAAEIKYSQPLDEIKEMYVKTLQERKQRIANKALLLRFLKNAAVILAIVAAGIVIGMMIKSGPGKKEIASNTAALGQQLAPQQQAAATSDTPADQLTDPAEEQPEEVLQEKPQQRVSEKIAPVTTEEQTPARQQPVIENSVAEKKESSLPTLPKEIIEEKKSNEVDIEEPAPNAEVNERTGERNRKVRNADDDVTEATTAHEPKAKAMMKSLGSLSKQVSITSNAYQRVAFGGIRNLHLTINNDSKYILDNVIVELQYLKPSELPLRIETIHFRSVSPGGSLTVRIPDTNRGIDVRYKITHILSRQFAKDMADL